MIYHDDQGSSSTGYNQAPAYPQQQANAYALYGQVRAIDLAEVNVGLAEELARLGPFGAGNGEPMLALRGLNRSLRSATL